MSPSPASRRPSPEPFLWLLFSAGGMAAALVLPVLMLLFGVLIPLGLLDAPEPTHLLAVVRNPATKLVLIVVSVLALCHSAHRFRFTFEHALQLGRFDRVIALCCYGAAFLVSVVGVWVLVSV
ncbi:fumarate reductase subunit FrdD [Mycobacterium sp. CBMA293]|uniref:fumarate reductase subunit FrdD n=1 Tax=unclassified Mycolicibacterium TaxID=2636767 RepID=UPI00132CBA74|nr:MULTISPECIES: fumarate reductase subunit FrdD [unclassified Mycolicibacterium]MUL46372.1 fumarate reductase subunit FrdD [Mycolicibacterium sp. CBMA 360]MUL92204.1 fumarate reductase subunit FrdD [Mycolicibacterium sp. CBMA 230]MUM33452.1 fumarate reductase subunit FrdD [Mycolicibacterium sp. CBMA 361]MUL57116.1 fumarate reductase subunit FrdD [Mycolicibacterium sp. CBMA 335]MUL70156.1 fumarate reductase subunit FrdD [Mycolicibacterium sp. CBMA 311]